MTCCPQIKKAYNLKQINCRACHASMTLMIQDVRPDVAGEGPSHDFKLAVEKKKTAKKKNRRKGPVIRPGEALPDQGSCKHAKKSFRWFKFPCCQASFPCDTCHDVFSWDDAEFLHSAVSTFPKGHDQQGGVCTNCHVEDNGYATFSCIDCHEHGRADMADEHRGNGRYSYQSAACFDCHPRGDD